MLVCDKFSDQVIKMSVMHRFFSFMPSQFRCKRDLIGQKYSSVFLVEVSLMGMIVEKDYKDFQQQFCWFYSFAVLQNVAIVATAVGSN